jgi:hypothetical protein
MHHRRLPPHRALLKGLSFILVAVGLAPAVAQGQPRPAFPAPPPKYRALVRYTIDAPRDQHVAQYDALVRHLLKLGFEFEPPLEDRPPTDREDPTKDILEGLVPSANILKILDSPYAASVLLARPDVKRPEKAKDPVRVQLELVSGYPTSQQLALVSQVLVLLQHFEFRESGSYDHRGYTGLPHTRLRGTIPAGQLDVLLRDLRQQPTGWLAPGIVHGELPSPLRQASPVLITEVLPDPAPPEEPAGPPERDDIALEKISADLWGLVSKKGQEGQTVRLEILLATAPAAGSLSWKDALRQAAPSLFIEGRVAQSVTATALLGEVKALAHVPEVSVVRLPRPPLIQLGPAAALKGDDARALEMSGVAALHKRGHRGKGVRVAVVDSDFRGFEALVKSKQLPATTRLVDFTAHRNPSLEPDPPPDNGAAIGHGTHCALALALAAPEVDLTLVRIDPGAPYLLAEVADLIRGGPAVSTSLGRRLDELTAARARLRLRRDELLLERKIVLENYEDDKELRDRYGFLGPVRAWVFSPREWHQLRMGEYERDEEAFRQRERRVLGLLAEVKGLLGIQVVSSSLVWNEDQPLGGRSPLTRYLDTMLCEKGRVPPPLWLTSAGNTRGQIWNGLFRDSDGDGVMEFARADAPLPAGLWTPELAFLAWQPLAGPKVPDLPAKTRLRVSVHWTEPHDPDYFLRAGEPDLYLQPLARPRLTVLRQRDPEGKTLPADDFEIVARSPERPLRVDNFPHSSTYELAVEFVAEPGGRYALRLERQLATQWIMVSEDEGNRYKLRQLTGLTPTGIRPLGVATLPGVERHWQLTPRVFVQATQGPAAHLGRPVLRDFATDLGTVGVPADGRQVIAVGAADLEKRAQPYSAPGPPPGMDLFLTPRVLAPDTLDLGLAGKGPAFGTSLATSFAAGAAAALLSAQWSPVEIHHLMQGPGRRLLDASSRP